MKDTCSECGHADELDPRGRCMSVYYDAGGSLVYCGHKCNIGNEKKCMNCGQIIDPNTCYCGEPGAKHGNYDNHDFIPMGCDCFRQPDIVATTGRDDDLVHHVRRVLLYCSNFGDSVCICGDEQPKGAHDYECEDAQRLYERIATIRGGSG